MKKLISLLLVLVMVLSFAACGQTETSPTDAAAVNPGADTNQDAEKDPVTLTAWYLVVDGIDPCYQAWADAVNAQYPWITVDLEAVPADAISEKFSVACATGTTPDIYFDGYSRISSAVHAGLTIDLSGVVEEHQDLFYGEQKDGVVDGKNYYVAFHDGAPYCLVVNMTLAKELGVADMLPEDMETWSYDEFLDVLRAAKAADPNCIPTSLFAGSRSNDAWYYSWFLGNGANITNEELTANVINEGENKEKALEVLEVFRTMLDEELVPAGCASLVDVDVEALFYTGNMLFMPMAYNKIPQYYDMMEAGNCVEFELEGLAMPTAEGTEPPATVSWGSYGVVGFANNGHEEEARMAVDVLIASSELRSALVKATGSLSIMNDTAIEYDTPEITAIMARAADYSGRCANSSFGIREPWWSDNRETFYVHLQDFFVGNIDAETMLANWQDASNAVISAALAE